MPDSEVQEQIIVKITSCSARERDVDDISLVGGSTVDSLVSLQQSSAAHTRSEDFFSPAQAGVGQNASTLLDAGRRLGY